MVAAAPELNRRVSELADLEHLGQLLAWDQEVMMPPAGAEWRAQQRATVERLAHEPFVDDRVGELLPPLVAAARAASAGTTGPVWLCDPMHANTVRAAGGRKTRRVDDMVAEVRRALRA